MNEHVNSGHKFSVFQYAKVLHGSIDCDFVISWLTDTDLFIHNVDYIYIQFLQKKRHIK